MGGIVTAATTLARRQAACPYPSHSSGAIAATTLARRQAACLRMVGNRHRPPLHRWRDVRWLVCTCCLPLDVITIATLVRCMEIMRKQLAGVGIKQRE